jgi:CelD/BcsL family acetyltransferase involved in cellulose biosynthesis
VVLQISVENSFDFLSPEYADLFSRSDATVFQHPFWLDRLYARLVPYRNAKPLVITVRSAADAELLTVIPLVRRKQGGIKLVEFADLQVSDYVAPIGSSVSLQRILNDQAACKAIREKLAPYDLLRLQKLTDGSVGLEPLFGSKPRALMPMSSYPVPLLHSYEQWRADYMDRSYRKELDKKRRQLDRKGTVRFQCSNDLKMIETAFGAMREFRRLRFADQDLLQQEAYFEFYLEIAIRGSAMGLARTYVLSVADQPVDSRNNRSGRLPFKKSQRTALPRAISVWISRSAMSPTSACSAQNRRVCGRLRRQAATWGWQQAFCSSNCRGSRLCPNVWSGRWQRRRVDKLA